MSGNGKFKWWVGQGAEPEAYQGPFDTQSEALSVGETEYLYDGYTICEADKSVVQFDSMPGYVIDNFLEDLAENNEECWGEDGSDEPWSKDAVAALDVMLSHTIQAWLKLYPAKTWAFGTMRKSTFVGPIECESDDEKVNAKEATT